MNDKPIFPKWRIDTPLEEVVGEAVGAASACWEKLENTGIFDSERASRIVDEVVAIFRKKLFFDESYSINDKANLGLATTRELLNEIKARAEVSVSIDEYSGPMNNVVIIADNLLTGLPEPILEYKTVGGGK